MPPKGETKTKAAKALAAASASKGKKKKWSKGKTREKVSNMVIFDKATYDKLLKEIPSAKVITPSIVSERLKINGSLARRAIKDLASKGLIKQVSAHHSQLIYTRAAVKEQ